MGGGEKLVLGRAFTEKALAFAACATALFAITVLTGLVAYTGAAADEGLRRTLSMATFESAGSRMTAQVTAADYARTEGSVRAMLSRAYGDIPRATTVTARGDSYALPGQERLAHPELTTFAMVSGIERHATLTAGTWPRPTPAGTVEAALPAAAARAMKVTVGSVRTLHSRLDGSAVRVTVTGLFQVDRPEDYVWQGSRLVTTGVERLSFTTFGPFVVPPSTFVERFTRTGVAATWLVFPRLPDVSHGELGALGRRLDTLTTELRAGQRFSFDTDLPALITRVDDALLVARSTTLIPVLQLIVLAGYTLMLLARLIAEHRQLEVALLRARGAAVLQLSRLTALEGILLTAPGALAAPFLVPPLLDLAGRLPASRASGLRLDTAPSALTWTVSIGAALACALALTLPMLRGVTRSYVAESTSRGRGERRAALQRAGADLALLVVAGLGVWQLSRYGGPATAGPAAVVGMDPFIVAAPALALLAGGTLVLRLVPVASQTAERLTSRGRGLAAGLGTRQVSRRPLRFARPTLLLVMAVAIGVLSVATDGTWHRSQLDQADFQAGADLRVAVPAGPSGPLALGQGGRLSELPGVTALSPVLRRPVTAGDQDVALVAGDTAVLGSLLRARPDVMERSAPATLTAARSRTAPPAVPGRPDRIAFDLRVTSRAAGAATVLQVFVTMIDGRGVTHELDLGSVPADAATRTRVVTAAELAGPGGRITFPLMVRGVRYQLAENPRGTDLELSVLRIRSVDGTGTGTPAPAEWHALSADPSGNGAPRIQDRPDTFVTLGIPAATSAGGGAAAATSADRANSGTGTALAPIPGIITAELARRARVGLGGTVTIDHAGEEQPITVTGVVPALPSTEPDRPAVLVDLPTLTERLLIAGHPAPEPGEWWLAVRGADTAPAVRVLAAQPDWTGPIVDRTALRRELRDAPLAAAPQGALLIGFLAALVLALIGFTVNATVSVRERASEFAMLRALGAGPRQVFGMLGVEQAFLGTLGLLGGVVLGLAVAQLVIPHVVLTPRAAAPYPPVDIVISWGPIFGLLGGVVLLLGVVLALLGHALRRAGFDTAGRIGADG